MQTKSHHLHKARTRQDRRIILYEGLKLENQHTRKTLGTLSWIYKPSENLTVIGPRLSVLVVLVARPASS